MSPAVHRHPGPLKTVLDVRVLRSQAEARMKMRSRRLPFRQVRPGPLQALLQARARPDLPPDPLKVSRLEAPHLASGPAAPRVPGPAPRSRRLPFRQIRRGPLQALLQERARPDLPPDPLKVSRLEVPQLASGPAAPWVLDPAPRS